MIAQVCLLRQPESYCQFVHNSENYVSTVFNKPFLRNESKAKIMDPSFDISNYEH